MDDTEMETSSDRGVRGSASREDGSRKATGLLRDKEKLAWLWHAVRMSPMQLFRPVLAYLFEQNVHLLGR